MTFTVRYKNYPEGPAPYLFVAHPHDAALFSSGNFDPLPALSESDYTAFLSSYNDLIATLWRLNDGNTSFGFMPFALRNTWQSSYYQGAESCARLAGVSDAVVYFTSPYWFLWTVKNLSCEVLSADIARARRDARVSFLKRVYSRIRGVRFALSQFSRPQPVPFNIRSCFFSIWTASGMQKWMRDSSDPFYATLPSDIKNAALVYHLEGTQPSAGVRSFTFPVCRDTSFIRLRDWFSLIARILLFRPCLSPHIKAPREAILEDLASTASNQLVLALISYYAARNIVLVNPGVKFITLYEGNCWEQGVLRAASESQCQAVALQHTAFSPGMLKMHADTYGCLPSRIIASGPIASDLLVRYMKHKPEDIITGFRVRNDSGHISSSSGRGEKLLVLLQGSPYDGLILSQLRKVSLPYGIMVRCHPSQPYEGKRDFEIARGSLVENLQEAAVVLYNGTAAAFDALLAGVPCVYVSCGDAGRYDPLFDLDCPVKKNCHDIQTLPGVISEIMALSPEDRGQAFARACSYIEGYFRMPAPEHDRTLVGYLKND